MAKWQYVQEAWDNLQFGLRLGARPRQIVTTTPRPIPLLRQMIKDATVHVTRGSTYDNAANLAPKFIHDVSERYAGTRLGRQELNAEILDDAPGALWTRAMLDGSRRKAGDHPELQRIVVAIDPAASADGAGELGAGAETGIVVAGLGVDGRGYVLEDCTCAMGPNGWARRAVEAFDRWKADAIVAELNQGGAMVEQTVRTVRNIIPFLGVRASRGKVTRAEPVAALYEQGRVSHVGSFPDLEDQMVLFTPFGIEGDTTADRVDALVWALSMLFPQIVHHVDKPKQQVRRRDPYALPDEDESENTSWKVA